MLGGFELAVIALASVAAGAVNAFAGGGTFIVFPLLIAMGLPPVAANVTNTVALSPGYLGATIAQWKHLRSQSARLWICLPAGVIGGFAGGILLLNSGEKLFRSLVPFLILSASGLLALQGPLRAWLIRRMGEHAGFARNSTPWIGLPVAAAAIYGGYFAAGMSVIVLAVLGLLLDDSLTRLNALKQATASSINIAATLFFVFSGHVVWPAALVMAAGSLVGGILGGRLAGRVKPTTLRWTIVAFGTVVAALYLRY
ncbi:MAG TPA: sulfite exporter TauE/SafE family protein [Candidatus Binatia bacterium]|nr:sulfite exporter TauE/SafE family protein [Candidatus Binatia bacterium]